MSLERLQILVTNEQRAWLEAESARQNQPVTALIRSAIDVARGVRPEAQRMAAVESLLGRPGGSTATEGQSSAAAQRPIGGPVGS
jgi:hypothetical protein